MLSINENPLFLDESIEGWEDATIDIWSVVKVAKKQLNSGLYAPEEAYQEVKAVLHKYQPWGAENPVAKLATAELFCHNTKMDPYIFV